MAGDTVIRAAGTRREAEEWALVLAAADIAHRIEPAASGFAVLVPADEAPRAQATLDAYDQERQAGPEAPLADGAPGAAAWPLGVAVAALLIGFFAVTGLPGAGSRWFERGAASARDMLGGEPWRAVTALTLHVDAVHVLSNAVATALLLPPLIERLGPGLGLWLVLLAGAGGNVLAALVQQPGHAAVGASTATFGAIGILAALRLFPSPAAPPMRRRGWVVVAAALVLLALLGAAPGADVVAHGVGLGTGAVLGLAAGAATRWPLDPIVQWALAALAILAVLGCWRLALAGAMV